MNIHYSSIFSSTPKHERDIGGGGDAFNSTSMTAEHVGGLFYVQVVNADLTVCCPANNDGITGVRQEL